MTQTEGVQWWDKTRRRPLPVDDIVADYWAGMGSSKLSYKYNSSLVTIRALLRAQGIQLRATHPSRATLGAVVDDYLAGGNVAEIAEKYGASPVTVRSLLLEHGLQMPFRNGPTRSPPDRFGINRIELPESVIDDYQAGITARELAARHGVSHPTVLSFLDRRGVPRRRAPRPWIRRTLPVEEIVEQYESGSTLIELGERYNVDHNTILRLLDEAGVNRRPPGPQFNPRAPHHTLAPEAIRMLHAGHRLRDIAEAFDISEPMLRIVLIKAGVEVRGGGSPARRLPNKALEMYDDGWTIREIAEHFGMSSEQAGEELVMIVDETEGAP